MWMGIYIQSIHLLHHKYFTDGVVHGFVTDNGQQNNRFLTVKKLNFAFLKNYETVPEVFHAYSMTF